MTPAATVSPAATGDPHDAGASTTSILAELDAQLRSAQIQSRSDDRDPDPFRGLHLGTDTVAALLARQPCSPRFRGSATRVAAVAREVPTWAVLADLYRLSDFALAVVALALAPEIDERYGPILAWLQDDVSRRRPTAALALNLFSDDADERSTHLAEIGPGGTLITQHLVHFGVGRDEPLLSLPILVDDQIRRLLLGEPGLDRRLASWCQLVIPDHDLTPVPLPTRLRDGLQAAASAYRAGRAGPLRLALGGPVGCGQELVAEGLAGVIGGALLRVDLEAARQQPGEPRDLAGILIREAILLNAVVEIAPAEAVQADGSGGLRSFAVAMAEGTSTPVVIRNRGTGPAPLLPVTDLIDLDFQMPDTLERERRWHVATANHGLVIAGDDIRTLASRYCLVLADIDTAAARAAAGLRWGLTPSVDDAVPFTALDACVAASRRTGGHELSSLSRRIVPRHRWTDIVLPSAVEEQLRELCDRASLSSRVMGQWGFADVMSLGRGVNALFAGPSGTGKTMAAEIIAGELGLDLFKIDLARIVSKYIGETEKNLDTIFRAAEDATGILFFDEADALFGKRSEVRDSHDRYANLEISYLLQRMEEYDGFSILATNLHANLDDAFLRRLSTIIYFPFPEARERAEIWRRTWPPEVPLAISDIDLVRAAAFPLSGGNIRTAALSAAYFAAAEGTVVGATHVARAVQREYQKMGRPLQPDELAELQPAPIQ